MLRGAGSSAGERGSSILARLRRRFGRETTSGRFIPEIDGLRFPAIMIVVLAHLVDTIMRRTGLPHTTTLAERPVVALAHHAGEGVVLFFVISGFILALPFARTRLLGERSVRLRDYYLRRVTRLEPPYLISLTLIYLAQVAGRQVHWTTDTSPVSTLTAHYLASAAYLHNQVFGYYSTVNGVAWSLEVEIQFYLVMPLLAVVFSCRPAALRRGLLLATIVTILALQAWMPEHGRISISLLGYLQYFLFGFLLADLYVLDPAFSAPATHHGWDVVAVVAWCAFFLAWTGGDPGLILVPFTIFAVFVTTFRSPIARWIFSHPLITTIGGMCYSIYLMHFWVIGNAEKLIYRFRPRPTAYWPELLVVGVPVLIVALTACAIFFLLIERPCMDRTWPRRLAAWWRQKVARPFNHPQASDA